MGEHAAVDDVHTRRIAEFVAGLTYERVPAEVRERIKLLILDSLGCAIYGADLEWCRILRETCVGLDATRTAAKSGMITVSFSTEQGAQYGTCIIAGTAGG